MYWCWQEIQLPSQSLRNSGFQVLHEKKLQTRTLIEQLVQRSLLGLPTEKINACHRPPRLGYLGHQGTPLFLTLWQELAIGRSPLVIVRP
jgi:hypothetical protein